MSYSPRQGNYDYYNQENPPEQTQNYNTNQADGQRQYDELESLFKKALEKGPSKELEFLSGEILSFSKYKTNKVFKKSETLDTVNSDSEDFYQKILSALEKIVIEVASMKDLEEREMKLKKINNWYKRQIETYKKLSRIKQRTEKNLDQIDLPEPEVTPPLEEEDISSKRCQLYGFESAKDKIKEYERRVILTNPELDRDTSNDHYYYNSVRLSNLNTDHNCNLAGGKTYYNTKSSDFYKPSTNKPINNTGSSWFNTTAATTFNYDKEIKGSYSYMRPNYDYQNLIVDKIIIDAKNKILREKRMEEKVKEALNDFGMTRARFKQNLNKKHEMTEMINNYNIVIEEKRRKEAEERKAKEEEERLKAELKKKEQQKKALLKIKPKENREQDPSKPEGAVPEEAKPEEEKVEEKKASEEAKDQDQEQEKDQEQVQEQEPEEENKQEEIEKPKVDISNVKYITELSDNHTVNLIYPDKTSEKTFKVTFKTTKIRQKTDLINEAILDKIKTDIEINQEIQNTNKLEEINELQKELSNNNLPSDSIAYIRATNRVLGVRQMNATMNSFKKYDRARLDYRQHLKPLSVYDNVNLGGKLFNKHRPNTESSVFMKTFSEFPNDFLNIRKRISQYKEDVLKRSNLFKKSGRRIRVNLNAMNTNPRNTRVYPDTYLPVPGDNLLTNNF